MISQIIKCLYVITLLLFVGLGCSIDQHASKSQDTNTPQNINKKVFQKHEQPIIHEVSFESGSKINFKEKASIEQKFNIKLSSLQKQINDKKLPLHPETFLPLPNTPPPQFNDEKWEEFLSKLQPEEQELLKKMYAHKQFISYDMLAQGLAAVMEKFEELVQEDYAVAVFHNSSLQWVTSIASVYFGNSRLPVAAWEPEDFGKPGEAEESIHRAQDLKVDHFLIFCDAEYNGDTLIGMLNNLDDKDAMKNKRVTAFIPFVSNYVRKVLRNKRYKKISFELVTTDFTILPTIDHLKLEEEEEEEETDESSNPNRTKEFFSKSFHTKDPAMAKILESYNKNPEKKDDKRCSYTIDLDLKEIFLNFFSQREKITFKRHAKTMNSPTLTYTEWEVPDRESFFLKRAEMYEEKNKEKIRFLPEIIPPYKLHPPTLLK